MTERQFVEQELSSIVEMTLQMENELNSLVVNRE